MGSLKFINAFFKLRFEFLFRSVLLLTGFQFKISGCFFEDACMFILGAFEVVLEGLQFSIFAICHKFKFFYLNGELVDYAPCNNLLLGDPEPRLDVVCFLKKKLKMKQISEAAALVN